MPPRLLALAATLTSVLALAPAASGATATSTMVPVGQTSTGDGADPVRATITLRDSGSRLVVTGSGSGFKAGSQYITLLYDRASLATGPNACIPSFVAGAPAIPFASMVVGAWVPLGATSRTLASIPQQGATRTPLANIGTTSVRRLDQRAGPVLEMNLQSCGKVVPARSAALARFLRR